MRSVGGFTGYAVEGDKYDEDRYITAKAIAANTRKAIKDAVKAGQLPGKAQGFAYRVRSESFAGGQAVNINIVGPGGSDWAYRPVTDSQQDAKAVRAGLIRVFTDEAERMGELVKSFATAYTRRDIDSQIDYFHVSCYVFVYVDSGGLLLA